MDSIVYSYTAKHMGSYMWYNAYQLCIHTVYGDMHLTIYQKLMAC